jgi:leader peptidase (prepilin peptidase)/N-methyltransferase
MTVAFTVVFGGLLGLVVGSFFNVVVYRTPRHLSVVRPGSFCPTCRAEIAAIDNVPVLSWLWLGAKCRHCTQPISVRYPLVEAATAGAFAGLASTVRPLWGVPGWWALAATLGVAAVIEADGQACPPAVTLIGCSIGAVALVIGAGAVGHAGPLLDTGLGLGAGILCVGALAISPKIRESLGVGAIVCLAPLGACLGWLGIVAATVGAAVTVLVAIGTGLELNRRIRSATATHWVRIPLATCAACGVLAALLTAGLRS